MAGELTPQQTFENQLKDRLRNDIGNLMPDELLAQLVSKCIEDVFFKDREVPDNQRGYGTKTEPNKFKVIVRELLAERVDAQVRAWLEANGDKVIQGLAEQLNADAQELVLKALTSIFNQPLHAMRDSLNEVFGRLNMHQRIY